MDIITTVDTLSHSIYIPRRRDMIMYCYVKTNMRKHSVSQKLEHLLFFTRTIFGIKTLYCKRFCFFYSARLFYISYIVYFIKWLHFLIRTLHTEFIGESWSCFNNHISAIKTLFFDFGSVKERWMKESDREYLVLFNNTIHFKCMEGDQRI